MTKEEYKRATSTFMNNNTIVTIYSVGRIKKDALPSAKLIAVVGLKPLGRASKGIVSQLTEDVNPDNNKFSLPESDTASYDILARENKDLKAQVEALENEMKLTKGHKVKPEAVSKLARKLKKDYYSTFCRKAKYFIVHFSLSDNKAFR